MKQNGDKKNWGGRRGTNRVKTEKIVMLASAALIMSALTATGIYMRGHEEPEEIKIDLSGTEQKVDELANEMAQSLDQVVPKQTETQKQSQGQVAFQVTDAGKAKNAGALYGENLEAAGQDAFVDSNSDLDFEPEYEEDATEIQPADMVEQASGAATAKTPETLHFNKEAGLAFPLAGQVIMNYSMDSTVYYATLDQYKYQPGMVIAATEGEAITAAANARVTSIENDPVNGTCLHMDLGDDYELIYGQLRDIQVKEGDMVEKGQIVGFIANPTKYYSVEGVNLYVQVNQNETPVNPLTLEP